MNDEIGPQLEGWGTWPYFIAVMLFVIGLVIVATLLVRTARNIRGWRRGLVIVGVVVAELVTLFLISQPGMAQYGTWRVTCGPYYGALSNAFSHGNPDDAVLGDIQVACRTASRIQSAIAALLVGGMIGLLYAVRRLTLRTAPG